MAGTMFEKIWDAHVVHEQDGNCILYIDRHLVHEVTSPQAFEAGPRLPRQLCRLPWATFESESGAHKGPPGPNCNSQIEIDSLLIIESSGSLPFRPARIASLL